MNPRILVLAIPPQQLQGVNDFIINDYGKWFELYKYDSAIKLFHDVQLWVLNSGLGPTYSILSMEDMPIAVKKVINQYLIEILMPTNGQIDEIIKKKPPERKDEEIKK